MWVTMAETIRKVGKETLGLSSGKPRAYRESSWWNEELKEKIKDKNKRFKDLMSCMDEVDSLDMCRGRLLTLP